MEITADNISRALNDSSARAEFVNTLKHENDWFELDKAVRLLKQSLHDRPSHKYNPADILIEGIKGNPATTSESFALSCLYLGVKPDKWDSHIARAENFCLDSSAYVTLTNYYIELGLEHPGARKVIANLATNPYTPLPCLDSIMNYYETPGWAERNNPNHDIVLSAFETKANVLKCSAQSDASPSYLYYIFSQINGSEDVRQTYSNVRRNLAENPHTPREVLRELAKDKGDQICRALAANPNTQYEYLRSLAFETQDLNVIHSLLNRTIMLSDILDILVRRNSYSHTPEIIDTIIDHPNVSPETLSFIAVNPSMDYSNHAVHIARNPNTPTEVLDEIYQRLEAEMPHGEPFGDMNVGLALYRELAVNENSPLYVLEDIAFGVSHCPNSKIKDTARCTIESIYGIDLKVDDPSERAAVAKQVAASQGGSSGTTRNIHH